MIKNASINNLNFIWRRPLGTPIQFPYQVDYLLIGLGKKILYVVALE